jgi:BirA family biotin operon repressor/biotin-[acetyl-CoA-carboxylase] ligase
VTDPGGAQRPGIDLDRVRAAVGARWPRIDVVAETASTNADLIADTQAPERSVLVAEYQVAGRGRLDRVWVSPPRTGLTFSLVLRPTVPVATWGWLPLLAGIALHEAVEQVTGVPTALKWPNDLLAGTPPRKTAGVLAQSSGTAIVIGIGLNVSTTADELPIDAATSLALAGAASTDRSALLAAVLARVDEHYRRWSHAGGDAQASGLTVAYLDACATIGQQVAVTGIDSTVLRGVAVGLDPIGRLRVSVDGAEHLVGAGDVTHLR